MIGRVRRYSALAIGVFAAVALVGCAATATPTGQASPSQAASSEEPTVPAPAADPLGEVATIVVRPEALDLNDASGTTVASISYDSPAEDFVAALSTAIGSAPEVTERDGSLESPPYTSNDWSGFSINDAHQADGTFTELMNVWVHVAVASVGDGIAVTTIQGYQVGDDIETIAAENGWTIYPDSIFERPAEIGPALDEAEPQAGAYPSAHAVSIGSYPATEPLQMIYAPQNFGAQGH